MGKPAGYRAFLPAPLPPDPPVELAGPLQERLSEADHALCRLESAVLTLGELRRSQNWIGPAGCALNEAVFVTPPLPLVQVGLAHAQFETIPPFLLRGVAEVSREAAPTAAGILKMREENRAKIPDRLGRAAGNGHRTMGRLFDQPIVNVARARDWLDITRGGANNLVKRFVEIGRSQEWQSAEAWVPGQVPCLPGLGAWGTASGQRYPLWRPPLKGRPGDGARLRPSGIAVVFERQGGPGRSRARRSRPTEESQIKKLSLDPQILRKTPFFQSCAQGTGCDTVLFMEKLFLPAVVLCLVFSIASAKQNPLDYEILNRQAEKETLVPIRPGIPGRRPFWNGFARRFIWAPAFDFKSVTGAVRYRFTLWAGKGKMAWEFEAPAPWVSLSPLWKSLPVGDLTLLVVGIDGTTGKALGVAGTRKFYKASPFKGPYPGASMDYEASARLALSTVLKVPYVKGWLHRDRPPGYRLYQYPSKIVSAVVSIACEYASLEPAPPDAKEAVQIGRNAADYLLSIRYPAKDSALEYFIPTYRGSNGLDNNPIKFDVDSCMLIYPAKAGEAFLDLYDTTSEKKYLEAAIRIGSTYKKTQLKNGTWYLLVKARTGKPKTPNYCHPTGIAAFLDRLVRQYGRKEFAGTAARAWAFMLDGPVKDFNWEGQFEDVAPSKPFRNLQKGTAVETAVHLLEKAPSNAGYVETAEELLHFAEDQFVVWERPFSRDSTWFTPSVLEQYRCYTPVLASLADMIMGYTKAWEVTGKKLYMAKAQALADTITIAQKYHKGRYPTWFNKVRGNRSWLNCELYAIRAMRRLAQSIKKNRKH